MNSGAQQKLFNNRLVRLTGEDTPAAQVVVAATARLQPIAQVLPVADRALDDYAQIDHLLQIEWAANGNGEPPPAAGVGYAGLTPGQRGRFLHWLEEPCEPAPLAFQQLYLAHLEVGLLDSQERQPAIVRELRRLARAPAWHQHLGLARTTLLAYWLGQDGVALAEWSAEQPLPASLIGVVLGCQGLLGEALRGEQAAHLLTLWRLAGQTWPTAILNVRLRSLLTNLGSEPLLFALGQLPEAAKAPQLWRGHHRLVRLAFPQPDVRPVLQPLLAEALDERAVLPLAQPPVDEQPALPVESPGWYLILEFGQSRSDLFHFALTLAQRHPGFKQILDENRKVVYRVFFKKSEMRQFWRLWDYVQGWSNTHVYLNGEELEKWKVYPYSQFMK